jgi:hypothetical protein
MKEQKYRDVVFIQSLFPEILDNFESSEDFVKTKDGNQEIRYYLM